MSTEQIEDHVEGRAAAPRGWLFSVGVSAAVVAFGVALSATVNPVFDRAVHWDWMAVIVPVMLIGLSLGLRRRWF